MKLIGKQKIVKLHDMTHLFSKGGRLIGKFNGVVFTENKLHSVESHTR